MLFTRHLLPSRLCFGALQNPRISIVEGEESFKTGKGTLQPGRRGGEGTIGQEDGQKEERKESEIAVDRNYTRKCG